MVVSWTKSYLEGYSDPGRFVDCVGKRALPKKLPLSAGSETVADSAFVRHS
jgi:hypothetical protein